MGDREERGRRRGANGEPEVDVAQATPFSTENGGQPFFAVDNIAITSGESGQSASVVHRAYPHGVDRQHPACADEFRASRAEDRAGHRPEDQNGDQSEADFSGDPGGAETDLARSLLSDLRAGRGQAPRPRAGRSRVRRENLAGRNRGGYSGARRDPDRDPHPLGELVAGFVEEHGWSRPLADARVFAEWPLLVGAEVAAHCSPQSLRDGELRIAAESTAWATQLRLLTSVLLSRLAAELGGTVVRRIVITGPVAPSWKHGGWSVRGARGPRDTYG